jgi:hypothetical protein
MAVGVEVVAGVGGGGGALVVVAGGTNDGAAVVVVAVVGVVEGEDNDIPAMDMERDDESDREFDMAARSLDVLRRPFLRSSIIMADAELDRRLCLLLEDEEDDVDDFKASSPSSSAPERPLLRLLRWWLLLVVVLLLERPVAVVLVGL